METLLISFERFMKNRKEHFTTDSGISIPQFVHQRRIASGEEPGVYPFTRGPYSSMYRSKFWTMRQYAGFASAEESNKRYRFLLSQGQTGLSVAFDLPTQIGYDSDHPMAEGEVGKVGVAIDSLRDMEILFDGITLQNISTSMTINATASILLAMYVAVAKKQNADLKKISGTIQNDILKEYAARGTYIYPPEPSMRIITDIFAWCSANLPNWNTISISGYHIREAGSTATQEIAFTLANGISYVQTAVNAGLHVDDFAPRLSFFFNAHNNFFEEVAKFRAARRLWAKIMIERFGAKKTESMKLRFHAQTGGSTLIAHQIDTNVVRVTIQALAAVLGGCQSLHTNGRDEALALPTEESALLALRTQQIIAHESGVADSADPLGGSGLVEYLTDELERKAMEYIEKIDAMGGSVKAIEKQYIQTEIASAAYQYQKEIESKAKIVVGENEFVAEENDEQHELLRINEEVAKRQIEKLKQLRRERDEQNVRDTLEKLRVAAKSTENIFPYILHAVEAYATLGEISNTLREVWGEYKD